MGYIRMERLNTRFIVTDAAATVDAVAQALEQIPAGKRRSWYVVVRLPAGSFAVIDAENLGNAILAHGEGIRATRRAGAAAGRPCRRACGSGYR